MRINYNEMNYGNDLTRIVMNKNDKFQSFTMTSDDQLLVGKDKYGNYFFELQSSFDSIVFNRYPFMLYVQEEVAGFFFDFLERALGRAILDGNYKKLPSDFLISNSETGLVKMTIHSDATDCDFTISYNNNHYRYLYLQATNNDKKRNPNNLVVVSPRGKYGAFISSFENLFQDFVRFVDTGVVEKVLTEDSDFKVSSLENVKRFKKGEKEFAIFKDNQNDYYFMFDRDKDTHFSFDIVKGEQGTMERFVYEQFLALMERIYGQVLIEGPDQARWKYPLDFINPKNKSILWKSDGSSNDALKLTYKDDSIRIEMFPIVKNNLEEFIGQVRIRTSGSSYGNQYGHFIDLFNDLGLVVSPIDKKMYIKK